MRTSDAVGRTAKQRHDAPRRARDAHAPACGGPPEGVAERRLRLALPEVRDWITDVRARGGDFDPDAAAAAGETAMRLHASGLSPEDAFQAARAAYYDALALRRANGERTL